MACGVLGGVAACKQPPPPVPGTRPIRRLGASGIRAAFPEGVIDPAGWAADLLVAFAEAEVSPDPTHVCAVVAVLQQESGIQADPPVPHLGELVRKRLSEEAARYGPVGTAALERLLAERAPGDRRSFAERIRRLRTERDLDLVFRDMLEAERRMHPAMVATANLLDTLFRGRRLDDLNPVTTVGSMQVNVDWAVAYARERGQPADPTSVRDALYTRPGGLRFGVARLWSYRANYPDVLWRFADFNAGEYSSRNAAIQRALSRLTGAPLAADGDLLIYGPDRQPTEEESQTLAAFRIFRERFAPTLSDGQLRRDLESEKRYELESTPTYQALVRVHLAELKSPLPPSAMPDLVLRSPKLRRGYSTGAYARNVQRHHLACLERLRAAGAEEGSERPH
jgi:hypothetical protein